MNQAVDLTNFHDMTGGDKEMERELFALFVTSAQECLAVLKTSLSPAAAEMWRKQAHTLKGISLSLGALGLGELCKQAQEGFEKNSEQKIGMLADIENEYERVKLYISGL